jgi:16S rRNA (guanine527-N7)-methyltransferase
MTMDNHEAGRLSTVEIAHALAPYVREPLAEPQLGTISNYLDVLKKWNKTVPLTSIDEDAEMVARHFGESIFVASLLPIERGRLADVGSGAGFPGFPLKIAFPELQVTLIEPNIKKCAFLREVQGSLRLTEVEVVRSRYEDYPAAPNSFDFVSVRALGGYKRLLQWSKAVLRPRGRVILWLGIDDSTLLSRIKGWKWELPVTIPESRRRVILIGSLAS